MIKYGEDGKAHSIDPDPIVHEWREKFILEYGKFDYVIHDGKPHLVDVSKTVGASRRNPDKLRAEGRRYRALGIQSLMKD